MAAVAALRRVTLAWRPSAGSSLPQIHRSIRLCSGIPEPAVLETRVLAEKIVKLIQDSPQVKLDVIQPLVKELANTSLLPQSELVAVNVPALVDKITKVFRDAPTETAKDMALPMVRQLVEIIRISNVQADATKARILAEAITKIASETPLEAAIVVIRPLVRELTHTVGISQAQGITPLTRRDLVDHDVIARLCIQEATTKFHSNLSFTLHSVFICTLMAIPSGIYMVKLDGDGAVEKMKEKIAGQESRISALEARGSHPPSAEAVTEAAPEPAADATAEGGWLMWITSIFGA